MNALMFALAIHRQHAGIRRATLQEERCRSRARKAPMHVRAVRSDIVGSEFASSNLSACSPTAQSLPMKAP
jgi:hypothetical protein